MSDALSAALAQAKNMASAPLSAVVQSAGLPSTPVRKLTIDDLSSGMAVDVFPKKDMRGIRVDSFITDELIVKIIPSEVVAGMSAKWSIGTSTYYATTYDMVTDRKSGKPWETVLAGASQVTGSDVRPYPTLEVPMEILVDAVPNKQSKGDNALLAGVRAGFSSSTTGFKQHQKAILDARKALGEDGEAKFRVTIETKTKPGVQPWAEFKLEFLGPA